MLNDVLELIKNGFFKDVNQLHREGFLYKENSQIDNFFNAEKTEFDIVAKSDVFSSNTKKNKINPYLNQHNFQYESAIKNDSGLIYQLMYLRDFKIYNFTKDIDG